ncbi:hypothetical protein [Thermaerobacter composti]|uniref:Uncharacterized protein n=1 Tax=Thermaerobacter composti TaxID=554949 RepID=A0ABZ0QMN6_9FIRM|nr:hypothetical protein [Thermaerobacter composti]WPD18750.1 hypothetical protein Q5761_10345 [Thermaerobacter composti]
MTRRLAPGSGRTPPDGNAAMPSRDPMASPGTATTAPGLPPARRGPAAPRPRRRIAPTAVRIVALTMTAAVAVAAGGCTPAAKPSPTENRRMLTSLASDPQVQQAFARGRGEVVARDAEARQVILAQVVREQRRILDEPAVRDDALRVNADLTRATSTARETRPEMLENTVDLLEGIPDDPELRRRMVDVMRRLLQDPAIRADLMALVQSMMAQSGGSGGGAAGGSGGGAGAGGGAGGTSTGSGGGSGAAAGGPAGSGSAGGAGSGR